MNIIWQSLTAAGLRWKIVFFPWSNHTNCLTVGNSPLITTKPWTFPCPWRIHFGLFVYIYLLIYHKHQPFMDREIHHSHGFYGMIVTPACRRFPQVDHQGTENCKASRAVSLSMRALSWEPRCGTSMALTGSIAVDCWKIFVSRKEWAIAGTLRLMEGGWKPWVLRRVRLWISSSHRVTWDFVIFWVKSCFWPTIVTVSHKSCVTDKQAVPGFGKNRLCC